ncbi:MAG TPA: thrombospondin type 3 repeat-containing protein [Phycisphaerae bacterium]|nr:thrombospondin type 3 repeat-containing protein [Phycisphaerae bacterium]HRY71388.1 thrombospondin type 3 repeat-containing protein [Phycisphaerae bacterium]HSA28535.1 thrombospondin type 3 repeat-containing protein [Phycisphaerae bacterium]
MNVLSQSPWGRSWTLVVAVVVGLALVRGADAQAINPDFESGLTGWQINPGGVVGTLADEQGGFAMLQEAGMAGAPATSTLYQDFILPEGNALIFEYTLVAAGDFVSGGALPDAFTARLLNPDTLAPLISTAGVNDYFYNDSPGNIDFDPLIVTRTPSTTRGGWFTVTADLSTVPVGTRVRLQFDLLGTGASDGQVTVIAVDGVVVAIAGPVDQCPADPTKTKPGVCGCGVPDIDSDGDGVLDCLDSCPNDPGKTLAGQCGCGVPDTDSDHDGAPDCLDTCPTDANKAAPGVCGCGIADADSDGDGVPDCTDACPTDPNKSVLGACGCGVAETDTDGDGLADCTDACPEDPAKITPGTCGCGMADADTDSDSVPDCTDACPADANKSVLGTCGCGVADTDSDGDGIADCLDNCPQAPNPDQLDTDSDGTGDACDGDTGRPDPANRQEERRITTVLTQFNACGMLGAAPLPCMLLALLALKFGTRSWGRE